MDAKSILFSCVLHVVMSLRLRNVLYKVQMYEDKQREVKKFPTYLLWRADL
ncbi:hypothetical protein M758_UG004200 [Ceratodon purpureus]|uniref:Uncharacterized protein n=1 Tax=Ceratodon purpureus TaxID=3225 RepID=A0A8T0HL98_CERPU|nr:hypothetical protein KC19_VG018600 [Ceratodon purpureus]KAG0593619.1 hypothetical protein M758_UG004200 [Ceratodon purpureus]